MAFGETGRECRLNFWKSRPALARPISTPYECRVSSPPGLRQAREFAVTQNRRQKVFVIACQGCKGGWPFAAHKALDHLLGAETAVDVIAQKYRQRVVKDRASYGRDPLSHLAEEGHRGRGYRLRSIPASHPGPVVPRSRNRCFFPFTKRIGPRPEHGSRFLAPVQLRSRVLAHFWNRILSDEL